MTSAQGYADRLSTHAYKGNLNLPNNPDPSWSLLEKSRMLAHRIKTASHVVVHTGAGISTTAGINDFRGPNGVWTLQTKPSKRVRLDSTASVREVTFENAIPTLTHMVLVALYKASYVHFIISQNVDCLHLRSGLPRTALSELHGNLFMEWCPECGKERLLETQTHSVGMKPTGTVCDCGGQMTDKALDWDDPLPEPDFQLAKKNSATSDLNIIVGTSCQMEPSRSLPFQGKGRKNSLAIVNLSCTNFDDRFGLRIRGPCDIVFAIIAGELGVPIPPFERLRTFIVNLNWIDQGLKCCVLPLNNSSCHGLQVSYRCKDVDGINGKWTDAIEAPPYRIEIPTPERRLEARLSVAGHSLSLEVVASHETTVKETAEIVVEAKNFEEQLQALLCEVKEDVKREQQRGYQTLSPENWFVSSLRRGWGICCLCQQEVWCGHERRLTHLKRCVQTANGCNSRNP